MHAVQNEHQNTLELCNGALQSGGDKQSIIARKFLSSQVSTGSASSKMSKKRTRPAKRSPITVLSADTSNFKAMVQQFTGIPIGAPRQPFFSSSISINMPILKQYQVPETSLGGVPTLDTSVSLLSSHSQSAAGDPQYIGAISLTNGMPAATSITPFKAPYTEEMPSHTKRILPCATYHDFELSHNGLGSAFLTGDASGSAKCRDATYLGTATGLTRCEVGGNPFHEANAHINESTTTTSMQKFHPVDSWLTCDAAKMERSRIS